MKTHNPQSQWVRLDTVIILMIFGVFFGIMSNAQLLTKAIGGTLAFIIFVMVYKYYIIPNNTVCTLGELKRQI